ncbi:MULTISPECIES: LysR family transcriptional regulator [Vibrio]|uniref:LysR family transcriptional regulator n=1 Tax=Vibrio splendidus TaxID=29497 RepID=A0ABV4LMQ5_VIBSP|nr:MULTISPECIES: LysR family transcriptional regulator [Vibrio]OCH68843.1 LysR family transcriptional regulator [Vibrio splendidus]OMO32423.1 LysR family transcriptional regulator [Vibrio sp. 10N.222.47.A9]PMH17902.1 LysR family transcriptional regulator [Vibrio splendidus]PMI27261.1 LysR family transcriptional regulator [Vibrio splendidus]PMM34934.1 LysR family transcriptional regulator [Vibrio splendidus]
MKATNRTIDVKYLRTFSHVARHRSFTAAAESLYLTQPAVSQHIKKLESKIGATIFDRKGGFGLTRHGKVLLEYVDQTMCMYEKLFEDLEEIDICKKYSIAISDSFNPELVAKVINTFRTYNDIELAITSFSDIDEVNKDNYDLIFGAGKVLASNGKVFPLNRVQYILACDRSIVPEECYPERIVFCSFLTRREAEVLLSSARIDTSNVKSWLRTSSSRLMINELHAANTFVICPSWTIGEQSCNKRLLVENVEMYIWCNEDAAKKIDQAGLRTLITDIFNDNNSGIVIQ